MPPVLSLQQFTTSTTRTKRVTFNLKDAEDDRCSVAFQYSDDGGVIWKPLNHLIFDDSTVNMQDMESNKYYAANWKTYRDYHKTNTDLKRKKWGQSYIYI